VQGRPARPLSLAGLVAELRRAASDPSCSPALRAAAARRLAHLALATEREQPLVPHADPGRWWGTRARSLSARPLRPEEEPVKLSASALEALLVCPAKWFLEREAGGEKPSSQSQGFGKVVHALADRVAKGEVSGDAAAITELMGYVDRVWGQIVFRTPWSRPKERAEVEAALTRFLAWHTRPGARTVLATEQHLEAEVTLPDGQRVLLNGYADRLELTEAGEVIVVDLKTSKYPPTDKDLASNAQLGLYQLAVNNGAVDDLVGGVARSGGAELIQLRKATKAVKVQVQEPQTADEGGCTEAETQLMHAVGLVRSEKLHASPGDHCRHCSFHAICPAKVSGTVLS
jgi:RecB family exonuclease